MKASFKLGDVIVRIPVVYLDQQTAVNSIFDRVPIDSVDMSALIEANRTIGVSWYYRWEIGEDRKVLHISIPTEFIKWED